MPLLTPEGLKSHYQILGKQVELVEQAGFRQPEVIASGILAHNYEGCFWDVTGFAFRPMPKELPDVLRTSGLINQTKGSTRGNPERTYLMHFISPIAAYGNPSAILRLTFKALGLDPGIKADSINAYYPPDLRPSFWFSIGEDFLQDSMLGSSDEDEYRADLLGLRAATLYNVLSKPTLLSEILYDAGENIPLVWGQAYKSLPDYQVAEKSIRPVIGHRIVNLLSQYTPIFA